MTVFRTLLVPQGPLWEEVNARLPHQEPAPPIPAGRVAASVEAAATTFPHLHTALVLAPHNAPSSTLWYRWAGAHGDRLVLQPSLSLPLLLHSWTTEVVAGMRDPAGADAAVRATLTP